MAARIRSRRRRPVRRRLGRWFRRQDRFTRQLLLGVVVLGAFILAIALLSPPTPRPAGEKTALPIPRAAPARVARPAPKARPARPAASATRAVRASPPVKKQKSQPPLAPIPVVPRVAIVIDDLGQNLESLRQLEALEMPLTVAILPGLPATGRTAREAARFGFEIILHLPMEPLDTETKRPGEGALLASVTPTDLRERLAMDLAAVPGAVGVNNHMGSRFTADPKAVGILMAELKNLGLFWLDSRTTNETRGPELAAVHHVPFAERDVFLDAEINPEFIRRQLRSLVDLARRNGAAIGIGHPHGETLSTLLEMRDELMTSGVSLVPVSALARLQAPAVSGSPRVFVPAVGLAAAKVLP